VLRDAISWKSPPVKGGRLGRIYYATQAAVRPPTFVAFVNDPDLFGESYRRYLERALRENVGFKGTPIRLLFRGKASGGPRPSGAGAPDAASSVAN
jgi:GTPase